MSDITTVLDQFVAGDITTEQAAEMFAAMAWPTTSNPTTLAAIEADPDPTPEDGGFIEIEAAYQAGWITDQEYAAIVRAIENAAPIAPTT